jgi:hypothetical protein
MHKLKQELSDDEEDKTTASQRNNSLIGSKGNHSSDNIIEAAERPRPDRLVRKVQSKTSPSISPSPSPMTVNSSTSSTAANEVNSSSRNASNSNHSEIDHRNGTPSNGYGNLSSGIAIVEPEDDIAVNGDEEYCGDLNISEDVNDDEEGEESEEDEVESCEEEEEEEEEEDIENEDESNNKSKEPRFRDASIEEVRVQVESTCVMVGQREGVSIQVTEQATLTTEEIKDHENNCPNDNQQKLDEEERDQEDDDRDSTTERRHSFLEVTQLII